MSKSIKIPIPKHFFQQERFSELTSNLTSLDKVAKLEISEEKSMLMFEIYDAYAYPSIVKEFSKFGYEVPTNIVKLGITGMTCGSCVIHVENSIANLNGVIKSNVNLATNQATITVINGTVSDSEISNAVTDIGYGTIDASQLGKQESDSVSKLILFKASVSIIAAVIINIFNFSTIESLFKIPIIYLLLIIATPVQLWAGSYFYISAWKALKHYRSNMQTLIAIGTSTAYLYSLLITIIDPSSGNTVYFEASTAIIGIVLIGRYIEEKSKFRVLNVINTLLALRPTTALVIKDDQQNYIKIDSLLISDEIIIKPGDRIPTDGEIISGHSWVNESAITGESMETEKTRNSPVFAGTLNTTGSFIYRVTKSSKDSLFSEIIEQLTKLQESKIPIQKLVDKVSNLFVPTIILISIIVALAWIVLPSQINYENALLAAVSVLIIACPCALGLATPIAIMLGSAKSTEAGVVFSETSALESLHNIQTFVFDKTGTITLGKPRLENLFTTNVTEDEAIIYAGSAESKSEHTFGKILTSICRAKNLSIIEPSEFKAIPGKGIIAKINDKEIKVGQIKLFDPSIVTKIWLKRITDSNESGMSTILLSIENELVAMFAFTDTIKSDAQNVIASLHHIGKDTVLISGDNENATKQVASSIGVYKHISDLYPKEKSDYIEKLQNEGKSVCMIGDGINDAPALAQADVSIAMGSGTDVAIQTSGITVTNDKLSKIVYAIMVSKTTMQIIKQNLLWASIYNLALLPIAAGLMHPFFIYFDVQIKSNLIMNDNGLINPIIAALAMAASSISVIINSSRINSLSETGNEGGRMKIPFLSKKEDTSIDPVCDMEVKTKNPPGGTFNHKEVRYYFCGPGCNHAFQKEPESFLSGDKKIKM